MLINDAKAGCSKAVVRLSAARSFQELNNVTDFDSKYEIKNK